MLFKAGFKRESAFATINITFESAVGFLSSLFLQMQIIMAFSFVLAKSNAG
jgi:hypothetical protein